MSFGLYLLWGKLERSFVEGQSEMWRLAIHKFVVIYMNAQLLWVDKVPGLTRSP